MQGARSAHVRQLLGPERLPGGPTARGLCRGGGAICVGARLVVDGRAGNGERWRHNRKQEMKPMAEP